MEYIHFNAPASFFIETNGEDNSVVFTQPPIWDETENREVFNLEFFQFPKGFDKYTRELSILAIARTEIEDFWSLSPVVYDLYNHCRKQGEDESARYFKSSRKLDLNMPTLAAVCMRFWPSIRDSALK